MNFKLQNPQLHESLPRPWEGPCQCVHMNTSWTKDRRNKIFKPQLIKPAVSLHFNFPFVTLSLWSSFLGVIQSMFEIQLGES